MKNGLLLFITVSLINSVFASMPVFRDTLKVYPFDPVVVTGTRIEMPKKDLPVALSVITSTVIDEQNYKPLLDLVSENVPGLFVTQRTNLGYGVSSGSGGQISIRGIGGYPNTQVAVLIDGRPDIMGLFGHALGDAYFMHDVEKIEVIRGPASVLYGSNAMGGAINIIPRHEHQNGFHLYAPITYGNYNTSQSFVRNTYSNGNFGYSLSLGYRNSDGFRTDANDSYYSTSGNLELHSTINDHLKIILNSYISNSDINDPGQVTAPSDTQLYKIDRRGGDLTLKHSFERIIGELKVHYNSGYHDIFDGYKSDDYTTGILLTETFQINSNSRISGGIDLKNYGGKALLYGSWLEHDVSEQSIYTTFHQKILYRINVDGGIRYTDHSIAGNLFIPAIGLTAVLPLQFIVKTQYSEGYRNPTINELYLFPTTEVRPGPSTTELKQETTTNYEFSVEKQFTNRLTSTLTVYRTNAENFIQKGFVNGGPLYQNTGEITINGVEIDGQLLLPPRIALNWSISSSSYSQLINGSPGEKANIAMRVKATKDLIFGIQGQWINNLYSDSNPYDYQINSVRLDSYTLVNINANWNVNDYLSLSAKINNVFDEGYETMYGYPMPGRNFTIGITVKY
ncbi:TonB-dependent receptor [bacterium]|nr:TonB-dependent receptor [bacterium]MBU1064768.1 TonB-dependent receptor [bacterium]MBU1633229.1 TonB-dependent receptor [bacterium]MBU1874176.1 TonB-dependent receptor [bacterium]